MQYLGLYLVKEVPRLHHPRPIPLRGRRCDKSWAGPGYVVIVELLKWKVHPRREGNGRRDEYYVSASPANWWSAEYRHVQDSLLLSRSARARPSFGCSRAEGAPILESLTRRVPLCREDEARMLKLNHLLGSKFHGCIPSEAAGRSRPGD